MGKAKIRDYYKTFGEGAKNDSKKLFTFSLPMCLKIGIKD